MADGMQIAINPIIECINEMTDYRLGLAFKCFTDHFVQDTHKCQIAFNFDF